MTDHKTRRRVRSRRTTRGKKQRGGQYRSTQSRVRSVLPTILERNEREGGPYVEFSPKSRMRLIGKRPENVEARKSIGVSFKPEELEAIRRVEADRLKNVDPKTGEQLNETKIVPRVMAKQDHPISAIEEILRQYPDHPTDSKERMVRQILAQFPPHEYGNVPESNVEKFQKSLARSVNGSRNLTPVAEKEVPKEAPKEEKKGWFGLF